MISIYIDLSPEHLKDLNLFTKRRKIGIDTKYPIVPTIPYGIKLDII